MVLIDINYYSKKYYVGAEFKNSDGLIVKIVGKDATDKKSKYYYCEFNDFNVGRFSSDNLSCGSFKYPIHFSRGNNGNNKHKTIFKRFEYIKSRCNDANSKDYIRYGGRGIRCEFENVYEFWFEIQKDPKLDLLLSQPYSYEIDRIDNNGNYKVGNIRIVTRSENQRNKNNNFVYNLIDNHTDKILFTGIKIDCEDWIKENLGVKTSLCNQFIKKEIGKKNGYSVRYEITDTD